VSRTCVAIALLIAGLEASGAPAVAQSIRSTYRSGPTLVGLPVSRASAITMPPT